MQIVFTPLIRDKSWNLEIGIVKQMLQTKTHNPDPNPNPKSNPKPKRLTWPPIGGNHISTKKKKKKKKNRNVYPHFLVVGILK